MESSASGPNVALLTGITGQDGSYLTELLLEQEEEQWEVWGIMRRCSVFTTQRLDHLWEHPRLHLRHGDVTDIAGLSSVLHAISQLKPHRLYIFNLAAQSHVGVSFQTPLYTAQVDAIGALNLLEAVRSSGLVEVARIYQASTSEMFGKVAESPQSETTPFHPRSPYGVAKVYAYWIMCNYREAYGMHVCNGILMNHESPRRGKTFVTRKITQAVARIRHALQCGLPFDKLRLGNLDAKRDWGHARDYARGMLAILRHAEAQDFVLGTGEAHSVREFVERAFKEVHIEVEWRGSGVEEVGYWRRAERDPIDLVVVDPAYFRPAEVESLLADASKARRLLDWQPSVSFEELVRCMVHSDCKEYEREQRTKAQEAADGKKEEWSVKATTTH